MGKMFDALQKAEQEKTQEPREAEIKINFDESGLDRRLVSFFQPGSIVAEQFRKLRTSLLRPILKKPPKTILVTSALPGEGKSLISVNLAISIAVELHSYAMLVDCDLRNPTLSRWFGLQETKGLSDYLLGQAELPDLISKTSFDKLSILCGGAIQDNPVELVSSQKMEAMVNELKTRYDDRYIIFDSSPALLTTEPSVLDKMVDGVLIVVRAGSTARESVQEAVKMFQQDKIIGIVLNDLEFKSSAMNSRYFASNRYYYPRDIKPRGMAEKTMAFFKDPKEFFRKKGNNR
jgi:protein-tyrosine kinase